MSDEERARRLREGIGQRSRGNGAGFPLQWFRDISAVLDAQDFVQGLLVSKSIVIVYGQWGAGKTFWVTTLALHVAAGFPFAGRRVDQGGVVYCLMESGVGFQNRVAVWRDQHGVGDYDLPFVAVTEHLNMLDPDANLDLFIAACKAAAAQMKVPLRLIVIDTLARALSGGNENAPEDMGALVMNADRLRRETGAAVLFVHHSGKDQARGARGHSSLSGAVDTEIEITATDGAHCATVLKQRDLDKGIAFEFGLRTIELGHNPHSEPVTSCLVEFKETARAKPARVGRLSGAAAIAMRGLDIALGREGALLPALPEFPANTVAVPIEAWRAECYRLKGGTDALNRKTFNRGQDALLAGYLITQRDGFVWKVRDSGTVAGQFGTNSGQNGTARDPRSGTERDTPL